MEMNDNENDFITVYDGPNTAASNRVRFGRDKAPLSFTSTSNFLHIVFQSDVSFEFPGFYASFKVQGRGEGKTCNITHVCLENMTCVDGLCSCGKGHFYNASSSMSIPEAKEINFTLIGGITIGVLVAVCLVSLVIIGVRRRRKSRDERTNGTGRSQSSGMKSLVKNEKRSENPCNVYNPMALTSPARQHSVESPYAQIQTEIVDEHIYEESGFQEQIYRNNMALQTQDNPSDGKDYDELYLKICAFNDVSADLVANDEIYENSSCLTGHRDTDVTTDEDTIYEIVFCPRN
ncbi:unnamed protein product [Lymnaea stagnalis]|uniref:CUB domain-containing protein n=1 Tax=Lymnaea stagnalis TaxID=6523 RepID=A0AAV2IHY4_LYMST